ncbi:MAG: hypothetical protein R6V03_04540 [Kiritimatiellia bacterium]
MNDKKTFDFWYAVNNTEVVKMPSQHLETFGATVFNYHLISELMDTANRSRVREGRMKARKPQIIAPRDFSQNVLEGFGAEAEQYVNWLREHEDSIRILQYGYNLKKEQFSEHFVSESADVVAERVKTEGRIADDPLSAVLIGVDEPWDVCLIKLFLEVTVRSVQRNVSDMGKRRMFDNTGGLPRALHDELEKDFLDASRNPALVKTLGAKLQRLGVFKQYEDRFFSLLDRKSQH